MKAGALLACCAASPALALPIPLDFGAFYVEPEAPVVIDSSGRSATLTEDPQRFINYLSNVPAVGDPAIIEGGAGRSLVFDYEFLESAGSDDIFHVALLDGETGGVLDAAYERFFYSSSAGQISFDLSGYAGVSLGLQFELIADLLDADFGSRLTLSGLYLNVPDDPVGVPEPGSTALLLAGLLSMRLGRRLRR